jgi:sigma-E factor negative regulatory protein RseA
MSKEIREQLSAFLDNELRAHEVKRTLDLIGAQPGLRQTWDRYHLIGDVIRGEGVRLSRGGIADGVRRHVESEPAILSAPAPQRGWRKPQPGQWMRPAAGAALAASVAAFAVMVLPDFTTSTREAEPQQLARVPAPASGWLFLERTGTRWKNLEQPGVESKLNRYLVEHSEYASARGMTGVLPYTSFVSYDTSNP